MNLFTKDAMNFKYLLFFINSKTVKGSINTIVTLRDILSDRIVCDILQSYYEVSTVDIAENKELITWIF